MALAGQADVEARLRRNLTPDEEQHLHDILWEVDVVLRSHCTLGIPDPAPDDVVLVASRMAARAVTSAPQGPEVETVQQSAGIYQQSMRYTAERASGAAVYLTRADMRLLRKHRNRVVSVRTWE